MEPWSRFTRPADAGGSRTPIRFMVDGAPFLCLGIQIDFLNTTRIEDFDYLFEHIVRLGCNTVFFPLRWFVFEPAEGQFDFAVLDHALRRCREHGLRMSLLWFGSNQGGQTHCAPRWINENPARFGRLLNDAGQANGLCPNQPATRAAEKRAFDTLLTHLAQVDGEQHTVILMQIQNEPCIAMSSTKPAHGPAPYLDHWQPRCFCPTCNELFAAHRRTHPGEADWHFGVHSLTSTFRTLLADQKALFPVPTYTNFPINPCRPGEDVELYQRDSTLDAVGADYYGFSPADLAFAAQYFSRPGNPLIIAEHSTESVGQLDLNLFLAVGSHGAVVFSPWAIDHAFGWRRWRDKFIERPPVGRDGSWSDAIRAFGQACSAINAAMRPLAATQGTDEQFCYANLGPPRKIEEKRFGLHWMLQAGAAGKFMAARSANNDLTMVGVDTRVTVRPVATDQELRVEAGHWHEQTWVAACEIPGPKLSATYDQAAPGVRVFDLEGGTAFRLRTGPKP